MVAALVPCSYPAHQLGGIASQESLRGLAQALAASPPEALTPAGFVAQQ
jgi:hypothetical protein